MRKSKFACRPKYLDYSPQIVLKEVIEVPRKLDELLDLLNFTDFGPEWSNLELSDDGLGNYHIQGERLETQEEVDKRVMRELDRSAWTKTRKEYCTNCFELKSCCKG